MPLLNRYWYVKCEGLNRSLKNTETKNMECDASVNKLKDVQDAQVFLEGVGAASSAGSSSVKVENPGYLRVLGAKDALKL